MPSAANPYHMRLRYGDRFTIRRRTPELEIEYLEVRLGRANGNFALAFKAPNTALWHVGHFFQILDESSPVIALVKRETFLLSDFMPDGRGGVIKIQVESIEDHCVNVACSSMGRVRLHRAQGGAK